MVAMLPVALEKAFALMQPVKPAWVLPTVFVSMTVAIANLIERRPRAVAALEVGSTGMAADMAAAARPAPAGQKPLRPTPLRPAPVHPVGPNVGVDLRAILLSALSDARRQARGRGARVEFVVPEGLRPTVPPTALRPVLLALLRNAIEHASGGQVFVGAMRAETEVRVIIIDDGPCVAEPLTGDARTSLARLLALSDASLFVDHRPGDGTTVMLTLSDMA